MHKFIPIPDEQWIAISALNHYCYCPQRCFYIHVEQVFRENAYTIQGQINHQKVDSEEEEVRDGVTIYRSIPLYSKQYGLSGKSDVVEWSEQTITPIEYKSGKKRRWQNDEVQLCAQALCIEEMEGVEVTSGQLFYQKSRRRKDVAFDRKLRQKTIHTIQQVREMKSTQKSPGAFYSKRCEGCSLQPLCLPKEKEMLQIAQT